MNKFGINLNFKKPEQIIVAGMERSGKTSYLEKLIIRFLVTSPQHKVFAYSLGSPSDYPQAPEINIYSREQSSNYFNVNSQNISLFSFNDKVYKLKDVFNFSRYVKAQRMSSLADERSFFNFVSQKMGKGFLIADDSRPIFRHGLSAELLSLTSKKKHVEKGRGCNIAFVVHNLDKIPEEVFDYTTKIVMFKLFRPPNIRFDDDLKKLVDRAYKGLNQMPDYSYSVIDTRTYKIDFFTPLKISK